MLTSGVLQIEDVRFENHILLDRTKHCNYMCKHCFTFSNSRAEEMSTEEVFSVLEEIAALGIRHITLSGGDPALRDDLPEIVKEVKRLNMTPHVFSTLLKEDQLKEIKDDVGIFATSLDGPKEVHDNIRSHKGAYEDTISLLGLYKSYGVDFGIQSMVTPKSRQYIDWLVEKAQESGAHSIRLAHVASQGRGLFNKDIHLDKKQMDDLYSTAMELNNKLGDKLAVFTNMVDINELRSKPNIYKSLTFHVLPNGDVLPFLGVTDLKLGNLRKESAYDFMQNLKASKQYHYLTNLIEEIYTKSIASSSAWVPYEDIRIERFRETNWAGVTVDL